MNTYQLGQCELQDLHELIALQGGMLNADQARHLLSSHALSFTDLKVQLLPICEMFAVAPISGFHAGTIAQGIKAEDGIANLYFGANLEFENQALSLVVHAEQAAIHNAWQHGERGISELIINAAPCGYCRQFINEIRDARQIPMQIAGKPCNLDHLLPEPFSPETLGNDEMLFDVMKTEVEIVTTVDVSPALHTAVETSYAPYTHNLSACEVVTIDGQRFIGRYAENCAYSPSLSPLQGALSQMALHGLNPNQHPIHAITLVELEGVNNQLGVSRAVLQSLPGDIVFNYVQGVAKA